MPYVGVGVGYQAVREKLDIGSFSSSSTKGGFATQGILGVAFPIESSPGLSITADYRFLAVVGNRTYGPIKLGNDYNHAITIGLRYAFGSPPPPPLRLRWRCQPRRPPAATWCSSTGTRRH